MGSFTLWNTPGQWDEPPALNGGLFLDDVCGLGGVYEAEEGKLYSANGCGSWVRAASADATSWRSARMYVVVDPALLFPACPA